MQKDKKNNSNQYTPQFLLQVYSPQALAEAIVVKVEWDCQGHGNLQERCLLKIFENLNTFSSWLSNYIFFHHVVLFS